MGSQTVVAGDVAAGETAGGLAAGADFELVVVLAVAETAGFFVVVEVVDGDYGEVEEEFHGGHGGFGDVGMLGLSRGTDVFVWK